MTAAASAAHGAACQELVRQGGPDHWVTVTDHGDNIGIACSCGARLEESLLTHSPDMVPFDALPEERKAYFEAIAAAVEGPWREAWASLRNSLNGGLGMPGWAQINYPGVEPAWKRLEALAGENL